MSHCAHYRHLPLASHQVKLADLPGLHHKPSTKYVVRDVWQHAEVHGVISNGKLALSASPHGSTFYVITPQP